MLWTCEIIGSTFNCKLNSGPTYIHWRPRILSKVYVLSKVYLLQYSRMIRSLSVSHCLPGAFRPARSLSSSATLP